MSHWQGLFPEWLIEVAENLALSRKVSTVVHDEAANLELCSAHCLQLCLKAGLTGNAIDRLIGAACKLVGHINHSVVASEQLKKRKCR